MRARSDRKASESSGHSEEDRKTFLSKKKDFVIGGAGSGFDVIRIFSMLTQDDRIEGSNIVERSKQQLAKYSDPYANVDVKVDALLIAYENKELAPYEVRIRGNQFYINRISTIYRCCGISAARVIASYFLKKKKLDELHWMEAAQYAIATMKEVGKEVDGVGRLEDFGFDITIMLDDGSVYESENYRENSAKLVSELKILRDTSAKFIRIKRSTEGK